MRHHAVHHRPRGPAGYRGGSDGDDRLVVLVTNPDLPLAVAALKDLRAGCLTHDSERAKVASGDKEASWQRAERLGVEVRNLPTGGHCLYMDRPEELAEALRPLLREITG